MNPRRFENKVAIVTGSASGIGRAILTAFTREGARGILADIDRAGSEKVAALLRAEGGEVLVCPTDVTNAAQVDALVETAVQTYGALHIMVHNAGVGVHKFAVDLSEEEWDRQVDVHLKGAFLCCRAAARQMIRQGQGGRLINIGSTAAGNARVQAAPHCASKAAIVMFTQVLALELGQYNITANVVSPGLTDIAAISRTAPKPEYIQTFLTMVPLGRLARPEEIASMVLYLASDEASFVSGQTIYVDGGYSAGKLSIRGPHRETRT